jgi:hypothetical protein
MALLEEDEWALFLDHDAMFLDRDWLSRAKRIIREHPSFGLLTCRTNRINNPFQKVEGHEDIHDLDHHARLTEALWETHATRVTDVSFGKSISGVILLLSKQAFSALTTRSTAPSATPVARSVSLRASSSTIFTVPTATPHMPSAPCRRRLPFPRQRSQARRRILAGSRARRRVGCGSRPSCCRGRRTGRPSSTR